MKEKEFEDIIVKYPELIEEGLKLLERQPYIFGRRMDLLFEDRFKRKLIVELKKGPIKDEHIGQILSYEGMILSHDNPDVRVMLIGSRVPPNIRRALDHHGIAWREIPSRILKEFLTEKNDNKLLELFLEGKVRDFEKSNKFHRKKIQYTYSSGKIQAALLVPVEKRWIDKAFEHFKSGKEKLYFFTDANIGQARNLPIRTVYFKPKGTTAIIFKADFIDITSENPVKYRQSGWKDTGKFYYGFENIRKLKNPVELIDLKYFTTGKNLIASQPGACIIVEPEVG
jgi:hypothetical protein